MNDTEDQHIFDDIDKFLKRFLHLTDNEIVLIRTWFVRTYFNDEFEIGAILRITSAKMRSGKSRVRQLAKLLCKNAFSVTAPTAASLWTIIDSQEYPPMIAINEADRMFEQKGDELSKIIATLDASVQKGEPVPRTMFDSGKRKVEWLPTYCNILLDGIDNGRTPDTIEDRSITIRMKRKKPGHRIEKLREIRLKPEAMALRVRLQKFADDNRSKLTLSPSMPDGLNDREEDKFETLISVADVAGGAYGARLKEAILSNSKENGGGIEQDNDIELLENIRDILPAIQKDVIDKEILFKGEHILNGVKGINSFWHTYEDGKELTEKGMAKMLAPHGIVPKKVRQLNNKRRYVSSDLYNGFNELLEPLPPEIGATRATSAPSATDDNIEIISPHLSKEELKQLGEYYF